jgi:hypothetical protein
LPFAPAAFAAIEATLPNGSQTDAGRNGSGGDLVTLLHGVIPPGLQAKS